MGGARRCSSGAILVLTIGYGLTWTAIAMALARVIGAPLAFAAVALPHIVAGAFGIASASRRIRKVRLMDDSAAEVGRSVDALAATVHGAHSLTDGGTHDRSQVGRARAGLGERRRSRARRGGDRAITRARHPVGAGASARGGAADRLARLGAGAPGRLLRRRRSCSGCGWGTAASGSGGRQKSQREVGTWR